MGSYFSRSLKRRVQQKNKRSITVDITEKVLEVMREEGKPLNAGKIAEFGGLDRKEVDKAMAKLKKEEKIVSPKRCFWEPA
jgi:hypothetical protein